MKILQLCYEFPPLGGGGSRVVQGLSRELARAGHHVEVVTMSGRGLPRTERRDGVLVHRIPCLRRRAFRCTIVEAAVYVLAARATLRRLVDRYRFDVNHTHFILPDGLNAAWLWRVAGLRYLITAHGSDVPCYDPHRLRFAHRVSAGSWRRAARGALTIVCPSRTIEALVHGRDPSLRTRVVPYGFDSRRWNAGRQREKRILVVSRLLRRKRVQHLLRAVADLSIDHEIHIVGDGECLPQLERQARSCLPRVRFHGWLENGSAELTRLYETSDIFVLPSERENFPVSLMEAMAAGLAVVTTRGTGCEEVVGEAGVLVEPGDVEALREAVVTLIADPARSRSLGRAARARLEQELSWSAVAARYLELYAEPDERRRS